MSSEQGMAVPILKLAIKSTFVLLGAFCLLTQGDAVAQQQNRNGAFRRIKKTFEFGRSGHVVHQISDGKIIVAAGAWGDLGGENVAEIFDPIKSTFGRIESRLSEPRSGAAQIVFPDGKLMLLGGAADFELAMRTSDVFDPSSRKFARGPEMVEERSGHSATLLADGRVLVAGGTGGRDCIHDSIEILDQKRSEFGKLSAKLLVPRTNHTATMLDEKHLLIAGGETGSSCDSDEGESQILSTAEIINIQTMTSESVKLPMKEPRLYHTASLMKDGRVLIAGGLKSQGVSVGVLESFNPQSREFQTVGSTLVSRSLHASFMLENEDFLVVGGVSDGVPQSSAERCSKAGERFVCRLVANMSVPRWLLNGVVLKNGQVLIVGGLTNKIEPGQSRAGPSRSVEIFIP
ncbi:MAG: Kelch repeat-containing protein [Silvanigrellaceae bacterium]